MSEGRNTDFWRVLSPTAWPEAPLWMSFSTLIELEICPRRWALTAAKYSNLWNNRAYPSVPQPSALEGTVVHLSLQKITGALVENSCPSLVDESAILTLTHERPQPWTESALDLLPGFQSYGREFRDSFLAFVPNLVLLCQENPLFTEIGNRVTHYRMALTQKSCYRYPN